MEYVPKNLLRMITSNCGLDIAMAKQIARDVFDALQYLHALKIVHRDIKMSNVLVTDENRAKLCDFGLALRLDETNEFSVAGTSEYYPPEYYTANGKLQLTALSDVWSAGVTLYAMLFGTMPFNDRTKYATSFRIKNCAYNIPYKKEVAETADGRYVVDLLKQIFVSDLAMRPPAKEVLSHPFFQRNPDEATVSIDYVLSGQLTFSNMFQYSL